MCSGKLFFRWFIYFMADRRNTLSYHQEVFQPAAGTCQEPRSLLLTIRIAPCSYIFNLGWSLYNFLCFLSTPTDSNVSTWQSSFCLISFWRALLFLPFFLSTKNPLFPRTCTLCMEDIHVILYQQDKSLPSHKLHPDLYSWQSRSGSLELAVRWLPSFLLTRHKWKMRQTGFPHKGVGGLIFNFCNSLLSLSSTQYTCTVTQIGLAQEKAFLNNSICCIFHGSHQHLFCVRLHYSFPSSFNQYSCTQSVLLCVCAQAVQQ